MSGNNIVIVGGGFAGVSALRHLYRSKRVFFKDFRLILVDRKDNHEFLPMLPDVIGGWMRPENLSAGLKKISDRHSCEFINDEAANIDFEKRELKLSAATLSYEFLIICSGSETNFFGDEKARANCFKLDNVADAVRIRENILNRSRLGNINVVIVGGGYTGVEIATNVRRLLGKGGPGHKIHILERAGDILMMVPEWIRKEVGRELKNLDIEINCNDSLKEYDGEKVLLESGRSIENAFCIWAAGVKTSSFIDKADVAKERTRIRVEGDLGIARKDKNVFVAGDAGYFFDDRQKQALRMAVMFSMGQGKTAAVNVINNISKRPLCKYKAVDLGYLVPMAHGVAPGIALGRSVRGRLGYLMHYSMCVYLSERENKPGIIKDFISR